MSNAHPRKQDQEKPKQRHCHGLPKPTHPDLVVRSTPPILTYKSIGDERNRKRNQREGNVDGYLDMMRNVSGSQLPTLRRGSTNTLENTRNLIGLALKSHATVRS